MPASYDQLDCPNTQNNRAKNSHPGGLGPGKNNPQSPVKDGGHYENYNQDQDLDRKIKYLRAIPIYPDFGLLHLALSRNF